MIPKRLPRRAQKHSPAAARASHRPFLGVERRAPGSLSSHRTRGPERTSPGRKRRRAQPALSHPRRGGRAPRAGPGPAAEAAATQEVAGPAAHPRGRSRCPEASANQPRTPHEDAARAEAARAQRRWAGRLGRAGAVRPARGGRAGAGSATRPRPLRPPRSERTHVRPPDKGGERGAEPEPCARLRRAVSPSGPPPRLRLPAPRCGRTDPPGPGGLGAGVGGEHGRDASLP